MIEYNGSMVLITLLSFIVDGRTGINHGFLVFFFGMSVLDGVVKSIVVALRYLLVIVRHAHVAC
jgi:hypothetical protein